MKDILSDITVHMKYAKHNDDLDRRETWSEIVTRNKENKCNQYADLTISLEGTSEFPGQTGGNNNNFHFEDFLSKLTHIAVGLLKEKVNNEN